MISTCRTRFNCNGHWLRRYVRNTIIRGYKFIDHVQLAQLEKEVKEQSKKEAQKEQKEAEAPIINPGGFGRGLLLTNGIVGQAPPMNGVMPVSSVNLFSKGTLIDT